MFYTSRYLCDVLEEMRQCIKTLRFDILPGLIEEAQAMGNRMESAIEDKKILDDLKDTIHDLKREKKKLDKEIKLAKRKTEDLGIKKDS